MDDDVLKLLRIPEGTKAISLQVSVVDRPLVVYMKEAGQQAEILKMLGRARKPLSALGLAMYLASIGIRSQMFPPQYKQRLIQAFSKL